MTNPLITIHNTSTDKIITREMDAAEFKQYEIDRLDEANRATQADAAATAKVALLARLGITADEAKLLIG